MPNDLRPLKEILSPKKERPHLVANVEEAIAHPVRTLQDYLFTSGIRGHFERLFRDLKEERGGGYWVQAEYGGGKTHFLASLLCLLSEASDEVEAATWRVAGDSEMRLLWEKPVRSRKLLGAHMSLMGTAAVVGRQESLLALIDDAIVAALAKRGIADPGISASSEALRAYAELAPAIRGEVDRAFLAAQGISVAAHRGEFGDDAKTAQALVLAAEAVSVDLLKNRQVQDHARHVLGKLRSCEFDGLLLVIDEYLSRESALDDAQKNEDAAILETLGFKLGRELGLPFYVVVASQGPLPAKLKERFDPLTLLGQDNEYSQIVCKRVMDYLPGVDDQSLLYHKHFSRSFSFLRRVSEQETRAIFPFQPAVFRFLRDLVSAPRVTNIPSARFAIGSTYDALVHEETLSQSRFVTTADLMRGSLAHALSEPIELKDAANALRQAREFVDNSDWQHAALPAFAHRIIDHLYLYSFLHDSGQTIEQLVEGTLIEDPSGMLAPSAMVKAVLQGLRQCEQITSKNDSWSFAARVSEGEQFEAVFGRELKTVKSEDPRLQARWADLLTATINQAGGQPPYLSPVVQGISVEVEHSGIVFPGRSVWAARNVQSHTESLKRLTQPERVRVVFVPTQLTEKPRIDDPAIAVVSPGSLPPIALDELRKLVTCEQILEEYSGHSEVGAEKIREEAGRRARELTRSIVQRQKGVYQDGDIYTRDDLPLNAKQLLKDPAVKNGVELIAGQLVRHVYLKAAEVLKGRALRGAMKPADAQKVFDAIFGGATGAQAKGAAEAFAPLLGLSSSTEPLRLAMIPNGGVDAAQALIAAQSGAMEMADVYDRFCEEPYGLPKGVIDLWVFGCVALGKPYALELQAGSGVTFEPRPEFKTRGVVRSLRASQLQQVAWPKDGLTGATIVQSRETSWNDFAPIALAVDSQRFSMTTDTKEIEHQQLVFINKLEEMKQQWDEIRRVLNALRESASSEVAPETLELLKRVKAFSDLRESFDRDAAMKAVSDTWGPGADGVRGLQEDMKQLSAFLPFAAESAVLSSRLSWFKELSARQPEALATDIGLAAPLLSLSEITGHPRQLHTAISTANVLHAKFMTEFSRAHRSHVSWAKEQRDALQRAAGRLPTLDRLNRIKQLGAPELPGAAETIAQLATNLRVCETPDDPKVGSGIACHSCGFRMGDVGSQPVGQNAEAEVAAAITRRGLALTAGLIAETLRAAGDNDLTAVLAVAQAGSFDDVIQKDLLTDELIARINAILARSKQQTVAGGRVFSFIQAHPTLTAANLDEWLRQLRAELLQDLNDAQTAHKGKEVTLLLKAGDDD